MNPLNFLTALIVVSATLATAACTAPEPDDDDLDASEPSDSNAPLRLGGGGERPPPSGTNGLRPACFWAAGAQQALRGLGTAPLAHEDGLLPPIGLNLLPEGCRDVLADAVECALRPDQAVHDPVTGADYHGRFGLAPTWRTEPLNSDGRRYVTACLVQRLNASGSHVPILLEGPAPPIAENATLVPLYPVAESTVFGDLFSAPAPLLGLLPSVTVYACWEDLLPQSGGLLGLPLLSEERICDDLPLCGFLPLGPCSLVCTDNGPYHKCKPGLLSPWWTQTVRVRLEDGGGD